MQNAVIEKLRHLVGARTEKFALAMSLLPSGIPQGALSEISGHGKTEFVLQFLREHPQLSVAWIEKNFSAYPFGFLQKQICLNRVLFMEGGKDLPWCAYQALRAQVFQVVVVYCENLELNTLRRLQLQSEKSGASTLWLTDKPKDAWPVHLRVAIERDETSSGGVKATVLKQRS